MEIKEIPIEELELMSYTDLTYLLIKENKKSANTPVLFRMICDLLDLSDSKYTSKIGEYYTSLNIDKRFVLLENNEWDIRDNHSVKIVIDDEDENENEEEEVEEEEVIDDIIDDVEIDDIDEVIDEDVDDDIDELSIITDEELEEE